MKVIFLLGAIISSFFFFTQKLQFLGMRRNCEPFSVARTHLTFPNGQHSFGPVISAQQWYARCFICESFETSTILIIVSYRYQGSIPLDWLSQKSHTSVGYIQSRGVGLDLSQNTGFSYVSLALLLLVRLLFGFASKFCLSFLQFLSNSTTDCETAIGCLGDRF